MVGPKPLDLDALAAHHGRTVTLSVPEVTENTDGIPAAVTEHHYTATLYFADLWTSDP